MNILATSAQSTQTVFTISSTKTATQTTPTFTTTMLPQSTSLPQPTPQPHKLTIAGAGSSNHAGIAVGIFFGVVGTVGLIGYGVYKLVQRNRRNHAEPQLFLSDSDSMNDEEIVTRGDNMQLLGVLERNQSETTLDGVSVASRSSRASSESPGSSRSPSPSLS